MGTLASNLEEKVINALGYEDKHWEAPRKLFRNMIDLCLLHNIPVLMKKDRVERVKIHIVQPSKGLDYGLCEAKPFVRGGRLYLSFNGLVKLEVDAAEAFGEEVQAL